MKSRLRERMERGELKALLRGKNATADFIHARYLHWNRDWSATEIAELLCRPLSQIVTWLQLDLENVSIHAGPSSRAKMSAKSSDSLFSQSEQVVPSERQVLCPTSAK
jgi:hypothetical protein